MQEEVHSTMTITLKIALSLSLSLSYILRTIECMIIGEMFYHLEYVAFTF